MKCIIAGGRDFSDYEKLKATMEEVRNLCGQITVISGCARGADSLGIRYAEEYALPCEKYPADWNKHGRAAGPIRNCQMAEQADILVAFWDGNSRGTGHMIREAKRRDLIVIVEAY